MQRHREAVHPADRRIVPLAAGIASASRRWLAVPVRSNHHVSTRLMRMAQACVAEAGTR